MVKTNADLFPNAEKLRGDREGDLDALRGREWEAVVDPSGYPPAVVRRSAELLADAVGPLLKRVSKVTGEGRYPKKLCVLPQSSSPDLAVRGVTRRRPSASVPASYRLKGGLSPFA